jgi:hypothetical protein
MTKSLPTLELLTERKISELFPKLPLETRLEASDLIARDGYFYLVFDNLKQIGRVTTDLEPDRKNKFFGEPGEDSGYEGITYNPRLKRYYILIESREHEEQYQSIIEEYDEKFNRVSSDWVNFVFASCNKGFEGVDYVARKDGQYLLAICEGNKCSDGKKGRKSGGGRIQVLQKRDNAWEVAATLKLPKSLEFEDYAGVHVRGNTVAVVSQASSALWVGRLRSAKWEFIDDGQVYLFPRSKKKGKIRYGNIEGITWLTPRTIAVVSDRRKKGEQPKAAGEVDQSIHIFKLPKN